MNAVLCESGTTQYDRQKKGDEFSILVLKHPNWIKQENNLLEPKFFYCLVWRNFVIGKM